MTEEQYIKFLTDVYVKRDGTHLDSASINKYSKQAPKKIAWYLEQVFPGTDYKSLYEVGTIEELKELDKLLLSNPSFMKEDREGHQMYSAGLHRYMEFAEGTLIKKCTDDASVLDIREPVPRRTLTKPRSSIIRDSVKIAQAKGACGYHCQIDENHITFTAVSNGKNYVEGHHIIPINCQPEFDCSLDVLANIIVLCPNCHRMLHFAINEDRVDKLYRIYDERYERFEKAGILKDRATFVDMATEGLLKENGTIL